MNCHQHTHAVHWKNPITSPSSSLNRFGDVSPRHSIVKNRLGLKRSRTPILEDDDAPEPSSKHFISEEKMMAQMNGLSISNSEHGFDNSTAQFTPTIMDNFPSPMPEILSSATPHTPTLSTIQEIQEGDSRFSDDDRTEKEEQESKLTDNIDQIKSRKRKHLRITPGLFNLCDESNSLLPQKIFDELRKPGMELVLYKAPENFVEDILKSKRPSAPKSSVDMKISPKYPTSELYCGTGSKDETTTIGFNPDMFDSLDDEMEL